LYIFIVTGLIKG